MGAQWYLIVIIIWFSLVTSDIKSLFMCLLSTPFFFFYNWMMDLGMMYRSFLYITICPLWYEFANTLFFFFLLVCNMPFTFDCLAEITRSRLLTQKKKKKKNFKQYSFIVKTQEKKLSGEGGIWEWNAPKSKFLIKIFIVSKLLLSFVVYFWKAFFNLRLTYFKESNVPSNARYFVILYTHIEQWKCC